MSLAPSIPFPTSSAHATIRVAAVGLARAFEAGPDLVLLHCISPAEVPLRGTTLRSEAHTCVLLPTSEAPSEREIAINSAAAPNWLRLPASDDLVALAAGHGIAVGRPFALGRVDFIPLILSEIQDELRRRDTRHVESVDLLVRRLFILLERHRVTEARLAVTPRMAELSESLARLQDHIAATLGEAWTVRRMADELHLSRTRFMRLYREFAGRPPMEDLIDRRLREARRLIASTTLPITRISYECGFRNHANFVRLFRKHVGCAPSAFAAKSAAPTARAA